MCRSWPYQIGGTTPPCKKVDFPQQERSPKQTPHRRDTTTVQPLRFWAAPFLVSLGSSLINSPREVSFRLPHFGYGWLRSASRFDEADRDMHHQSNLPWPLADVHMRHITGTIPLLDHLPFALIPYLYLVNLFLMKIWCNSADAVWFCMSIAVRLIFDA